MPPHKVRKYNFQVFGGISGVSLEFLAFGAGKWGFFQVVFPGLGVDIPERSDWEKGGEVGLFQAGNLGWEIGEFRVFLIYISIFLMPAISRDLAALEPQKFPKNSALPKN